MVSYICVVLYNLYSSHMYDFTYSPDGPFLFHVMDEESVSWVHPRSQSWSREHRGGIAEGGWVLSSVLRSVSSLRTLLLSPGSQGRASHGSSWWQNLTLGFHSCHWLRSLYRKKKIHFWILMPSWHYFCILCILLGGEAVRLSVFLMCKHQISMPCSEL